VASNAVPGFLPSVHGFQFVNSWPRTPAWLLDLGLVQVGIGDVSRGLCGGMVFAARDRFEQGAAVEPDAAPPQFGSALFREIVRRQWASFGALLTVPLRFWLSSALGNERSRARASVRRAWPAIRADIDAGRLSMVGLVREAGFNPLNTGMGHQVVAYRYATSTDRIEIGVYDPNHPGDDAVELRLDRGVGGEIRHVQSTGEPLLGLLDLPYSAPRQARER
jgi:hypothetical protein